MFAVCTVIKQSLLYLSTALRGELELAKPFDSCV
jgi:hypothetical protein